MNYISSDLSSEMKPKATRMLSTALFKMGKQLTENFLCNCRGLGDLEQHALKK